MINRDLDRIGLRNWIEYTIGSSGAAAWRFVERTPSLRHLANRQLINRAVAKLPARPYPFSTLSPYTSWSSLTDRTYWSRHLPPTPSAGEGLPAPADTARLFAREGETIHCPRSTVLFAYFAQWFTDGFVRGDSTAPRDPAVNTSPHDIDLNQVYGLTPAVTARLRTFSGGLLKTQRINDGEFPPYLCSDGEIKPEFEGLSVVRFADMPRGMRDTLFAMGSDRANVQIGFTMINVLFLREHNRIARLLAGRHPGWDDERLFQTARNIAIVLLLKIMLEEYINHITAYRFRFFTDPPAFSKADWQRTNHASVEFNLVYRWHSLLPSTLLVAGLNLPLLSTLAANNLLTEHGLGQVFEDSSRQRAGRIGLFNTAPDLLHIEALSIAEARTLHLASFNDYRACCGFPRLTSFGQISADPRVRRELSALYRSVDDVEFYVGLFAEDPLPGSILPPLMQRLIAIDAFSQAFTNPLLAPLVFTPATFSPLGMEIIDRTSSLSDLVNRNIPEQPRERTVSMTARDAAYDPKRTRSARPRR
ncbi:peroxidase family protein [Streptosporangium lutulentum]|uniref:Prostaglandin-endoperoxide synthase 2 n=1 Tax=Streptosporangium lutulentum TaxID=1461250 RepID=A0ABT9QAM4_9ACTN|nr:peroxidase family protein [Streptosporangium lutulentum]MDP9843821.1 prostaglandin-endoperoxide synthase 2 [Streptosporangium lutulentum]